MELSSLLSTMHSGYDNSLLVITLQYEAHGQRWGGGGKPQQDISDYLGYIQTCYKGSNVSIICLVTKKDLEIMA